MFDDTLPCDPIPPAVSPVSLQRARGRATCTFKSRDNRSVLDQLKQSGCLKVRLPKLGQNRVPEAVLLNTAGGLTDGDRLEFDGSVAANCTAIFTTQAAERAYRARCDTPARVHSRIGAGRDANLFWLPQETILFDGSRLDRTLDIELGKGASLVAIESILFGRQAMGEAMRHGFFRDRWSVRRDGQLIHADALEVSGDIQQILAGPALLNGRTAMATLLYVGAEATEMRDWILAHLPDEQVGVSAWNGKLLARITADSGALLRRSTIPLLETLTGGQPLPRVWSL